MLHLRFGREGATAKAKRKVLSKVTHRALFARRLRARQAERVPPGRIFVPSRPGVANRPLTQERHNVTDVTAPGDLDGRRLLVVDDERPMRSALKRALELGGFDVELAADGREGLASAAELSPDLVVLDVLMPGVDGLDVCRAMRARGDRTPVLMLTARDAVADRVEGLEAGADDYLVKPFALEELLARIRALLRRSREPSGEWPLTLRRPRARPGDLRGQARRSRDRADPHRAPAARVLPREPAPSALPRADLRARLAATTSVRTRKRSTSTSATCAARPRPAASRG